MNVSRNAVRAGHAESPGGGLANRGSHFRAEHGRRSRLFSRLLHGGIPKASASGFPRSDYSGRARVHSAEELQAGPSGPPSSAGVPGARQPPTVHRDAGGSSPARLTPSDKLATPDAGHGRTVRSAGSDDAARPFSAIRPAAAHTARAVARFVSYPVQEQMPSWWPMMLRRSHSAWIGRGVAPLWRRTYGRTQPRSPGSIGSPQS